MTMIFEQASIVPRDKSLPPLPEVKEESKEESKEEPSDADGAEPRVHPSTLRNKRRRRMQRRALCVVGGIPWLNDDDSSDEGEWSKDFSSCVTCCVHLGSAKELGWALGRASAIERETPGSLSQVGITRLKILLEHFTQPEHMWDAARERTLQRVTQPEVQFTLEEGRLADWAKKGANELSPKKPRGKKRSRKKLPRRRHLARSSRRFRSWPSQEGAEVPSDGAVPGAGAAAGAVGLGCPSEELAL